MNDLVVGALFAAARSPGSQPGGGWQPPTVGELQRDFPQFEIAAMIGRGGMGAVFKAWQKSLDRFVAIKILPPGMDDGVANFSERFKQEAKAMAKFHHPGIVGVYDAGQTSGGLLFIIMEFVEGTDVHQLLAAHGKLPVDQALGITAHVCEALAYAHGRGVIHRDIKPSNIMVDREGHVKVADFGLAKVATQESVQLTMTNVTMGTPDFMAPETLTPGVKVDERADLYAVGVMLYQMLTGKLPRGRWVPPSRAVPGLDKTLDAIVDRTLQPERESRYATATELRTALQPALTRATAKTRAASAAAAGRTGKKPLLIGAIAAALAVVAFILWNNGRKAASTNHDGPTTVPVHSDHAWHKIPMPGSKTLNGSSGAAINPAGELHLPGNLIVPDIVARNIAVRGEGKRIPDASVFSMQLRAWSHDDSPAGGTRQFTMGPDAFRFQYFTNDKQFSLLERTAYPKSVDPEQWISFEFAAIEDASLAKLGGVPVLPTAHSPMAQKAGKIVLGGGVFRNLEFINLDGLSEAEALKLAGVTSAPRPPEAPSTRGWQDYVHDASVRELGGNTEVLPEGIRFQGGGGRVRGKTNGSNGAMRVATTFPAVPMVFVRGDGSDIRYQAMVSNEGNSVSLSCHSGRTSSYLSREVFALPKPLQNGQEYQLELRAVGTTFSVIFDSKLLGQLKDATRTSGDHGVLYNSRPALLKSAQYLDLDGLPEAEALKLGGIPASAPQWRDALAEVPLKSVVAQLAKTPTGYVLPDHSNWSFPAEGLKAGALRWRGEVRKEWPVLALKESDRHSFLMGINTTGRRAYIAEKKETQVTDLAPPPEFFINPSKDGETSELLVARVGGKVRMLINGRQACEAADSLAPRAQFNLIIHQEPVAATKSLEYLNLDGLPEAEALKAAGLADGTASPSPPVSKSSAAAEPWQDWLSDPTKLLFSGSVERTPGGLRFTDKGYAWPGIGKGPLRDSAVRLKTTFDGLRPEVRARMSRAGMYILTAKSPKVITLKRYEGEGRPLVVLAEYPLRDALAPGQDFEIELRIVGSILTAKCNGEVLGTVTDTTFSEGHFAVGVSNGGAAPVVVKAVDVLDLSGGAVSPPPSPPVSKSSPAAAWKPLVSDAEWRSGLAGRREFKDGLLHLTKSGADTSPTVLRPQTWADGAIRARLEFRQGANALRLVGRKTTGASYSAYGFHLHNDGTAFELRRFSPTDIREQKSLALYPLPKPLAPGDKVLMELRIEGDHLTGLVNGVAVIEAHDSSLTAPGEWGIGASEGWFESAEVQSLEGAGGARPPGALLPGDAKTNAPGGRVPPPAGPLVNGTYQFTPGQWMKVFKRLEEIPASMREKSAFTWRDGWIDGSGADKPQVVNVIGAHGQNRGIRFHGRLLPATGGEAPVVCYICVRRVTGTGGITDYRLNISASDFATVRLAYAGRLPELASLHLDSPLKPGDEFDMELIAIGDKLYGKFNGKPLPVVTDTRLAEGGIGFSTKHLVRDIEVINLDGLSEAEALKLLGMDEKGNDLRGGARPPGALLPGDAKTNAPGGRVPPPAGPASPSPSPQVSGAASAIPPGKWTKVFTKDEDLPASVRTRGMLWRDGWIDGSAAKVASPVVSPSTKGRNQGIRLHGKIDAHVADPTACAIKVRRGKMSTGGMAEYKLFLRGMDATPRVAITYYDDVEKTAPDSTSILPDVPLKPGAEFDMELVAIGDKLYGKFNGKPLPVITDTRLTEGEMGFQTFHLVRDIEVINLDGLSEAEALKLLGIEKP